MTYEIHYCKHTNKEIHFILFPADLVYDPEVEISAVYKDDKEIEQTEQEAEDWKHEISAKINA